ncbi:MAG: VanZ family protein [Opitutaceae bacterium]
MSLLYLAVGWWPWRPWPENRVRWRQDGPGLVFRPPSLAWVRPLPRDVPASSSGGLWIEFELFGLPQTVPGLQQVLTLHDGQLPAKLAVCQWKSDLLLWIPAPGTPRGIRELGTTVADGRPHLITLVLGEAETRIYVDGVLRRRSTEFRVHPEAWRGEWLLGDAPEGKRGWRGELRSLGVGRGPRSTDQVVERQRAWERRSTEGWGPEEGMVAFFALHEGRGRMASGRFPGVWLELPAVYEVRHKRPLAGKLDLAQVWGRDVRDTVLNVLGFLPVGLLAWLAASRSRLGWRWLGVLGSGLGLSLAIETGQIWLPERVSSVIDLAANGVGAVVGGVGAALVARLGARRQSASGVPTR